jgi:hypothetical protein
VHDRALAIARGELGVTEHPMGSNSGARVREYQAATFLGGTGWPWCMAFLCWCWQHADRQLPYRTASAYGMLNWARRAGWAVPSSRLIPGDLVAFNIGSGHIAMFERWEGSTVYTIDGNSNDMVRQAARPHTLVAGGIHIPEKPVALSKPPPEPFWLIATSENGHKQLLFTKFATEAVVLNKILPPLVRKYGKAGITLKKGGVRK